MLMFVPTISFVPIPKYRWMDFHNYSFLSLELEPVKRPEMHSIAQGVPDEL